ncbi:MAG: bifunctional metallophosphatase/5'-nucleotidase [Mailhella sp.]|nr:bifunctional metallophosphatase/5'-nucleotidase [Mailhella sp.]
MIRFRAARPFGLSLLLASGLALSGCALDGGPLDVFGEKKGLELVILHTNDTHSHVAGVDKYGNAAFSTEKSVGGLGRIASAVKSAKAGRDNVVALDAGDQFQGTLFFSVNKSPMLAEINDHMPWDAMTLGNHEFDDGCLALARFLERSRVPALAANLAPEKGCPLLKADYLPHIVKEVRGEKVGIIGIANEQGSTLAAACEHTKFTGMAETLKREVAELEAQGVKHIIAVTHIGLPADRELARSVDGVDIIVGGHTHSFLGEGEGSEGPYPIVEKSPAGQPVLVVTAKRAAQYLGELNVTFDGNGVPASWSGSALELKNDAPVDPQVSAVIDRYTVTLEEFRSTVIGSHDLDMADGMDLCREVECLGGMLTADAMLEQARAYGASIAFTNGGGIRAALPKGRITRGDILTIHPFGNVFVLREYSGEQILAALEHGVMGEGAKGPHLLQPAGLRYEVDGTRPEGSRVVRAEIVGKDGKAVPLDLKARYVTALTDYLSGGGDGFAMLSEGRNVESSEPLVADVLDGYIREHSPLKAPEGGRIVRIPPKQR